MVGGGNKKDDLVISNSNVFAALGSLRKKKKPDKDSKSKSSSCAAEKQKAKEAEPQVFWSPSPLTAKSWADVDDEDDDDYYATAAPPQVVWEEEAQHQSGPKGVSTPVEESESEEDGLDEVDEDNEEEHENDSEKPVDKEPVIEKLAELVVPKESERQLSKKELKKKELAELEEMLAQFGYNKFDDQGATQGVAQEKAADTPDDEVNRKGNNAPGESKSAKKKKKKEKISKDVKEQHDEVNDTKVTNGTAEDVGDADDGATIDVKEKLKKVASLKKKKSSKEMDSAAKAAASEAAARNARLAAAKKKEKSHYNQHPQRVPESSWPHKRPVMDALKRCSSCCFGAIFYPYFCICTRQNDELQMFYGASARGTKS